MGIQGRLRSAVFFPADHHCVEFDFRRHHRYVRRVEERKAAAGGFTAKQLLHLWPKSERVRQPTDEFRRALPDRALLLELRFLFGLSAAEKRNGIHGTGKLCGSAGAKLLNSQLGEI